MCLHAMLARNKLTAPRNQAGLQILIGALINTRCLLHLQSQKWTENNLKHFFRKWVRVPLLFSAWPAGVEKGYVVLADDLPLSPRYCSEQADRSNRDGADRLCGHQRSQRPVERADSGSRHRLAFLLSQPCSTWRRTIWQTEASWPEYLERCRPK